MEVVKIRRARKKSPKINSLMKERENSPKRQLTPKSKTKKNGEKSPELTHIERIVTEKVDNEYIPQFNLTN
mgnify:FL=1|jgi:hypothetical protein